MNYWEFTGSSEQYSDASSSANILWIQLALHCDDNTHLCDRILDGWWGIGEKSSSCSPSLRDKFPVSFVLRCTASNDFPRQLRIAADLAVFSGLGWSITNNVGINELGLYAVYFYLDSASVQYVPVIPDNQIGLERIAFGSLRVAKVRLTKNGFHLLEGDPRLVLNQLGVIPYRGSRLSISGGQRFWKIVFDLGSVQPSSRICAQKTDVAHDDFWFGFGSAPFEVGGRLGNVLFINNQSIGGYDDSIGGEGCNDDCAAGINAECSGRGTPEKKIPPIFAEDGH